MVVSIVFRVTDDDMTSIKEYTHSVKIKRSQKNALIRV